MHKHKTKINERKKKFADHDLDNNQITTPESNKLAGKNFATRLKQANLV